MHSTTRNRFKSLSAREREVVARVAAGDLNKQVAAKLGLSEVTVKVHRAHAMRKMGARTLAHLLKMIAQISQLAHRVCLFIQEAMGPNFPMSALGA